MTTDSNTQATQASSERREPQKKVLQGTVMSVKMQKTVVVAVDNFVRHRLYKKTLRRTKRYKAHDETNACVLGDVVRIVETRPLSKEKRWRVAEILTRGNVAELQPQQIDAAIEGRAAAPKVNPAEAARAAAHAGEAPTAEAATDAVETPAAEPVTEPETAEQAAPKPARTRKTVAKAAAEPEAPESEEPETEADGGAEA